MGNYFSWDVLSPCVAHNQDVVANNESLTWVKKSCNKCPCVSPGWSQPLEIWQKKEQKSRVFHAREKRLDPSSSSSQGMVQWLNTGLPRVYCTISTTRSQHVMRNALFTGTTLQFTTTSDAWRDEKNSANRLKNWRGAPDDGLVISKSIKFWLSSQMPVRCEWSVIGRSPWYRPSDNLISFV